MSDPTSPSAVTRQLARFVASGTPVDPAAGAQALMFVVDTVAVMVAGRRIRTSSSCQRRFAPIRG